MNNWLTVLTTVLPQDAHMAKAYLESLGVTVLIKDELTAQVDNFCSNAIGGVKLLVHESNFENSVQLLRDGGYICDADLNSGPDIDYIKITETTNKSICAYCKSENIGRMREPHFLILITFFLLGIFIPIFRRSYTCFDCEKKWKYIR
jgi:hypothetical protein